MHAGSCEGRKPFFADNFNAAEIINKRWASKLREAIFGAINSRDFRVHWRAEKRSILDHDGQKSASTWEAFYLYVAAAKEFQKNVLFCPRVTEAPIYPDFRLLFCLF